jgi:hypothetical protein
MKGCEKMAKKKGKKKQAQKPEKVLEDLIQKHGTCWVLERIQESVRNHADEARSQVEDMQDEADNWESAADLVDDVISSIHDC